MTILQFKPNTALPPALQTSVDQKQPICLYDCEPKLYEIRFYIKHVYFLFGIITL